MRRLVPAFACLAAAALTASCTVYRVKALDAKALSAKGPRTKVVSIETKTEKIQFVESEPGSLVRGGVAGKVLEAAALDPLDIADVTAGRKRAKVVLRDGSRFEVLSSRPRGDVLDCEVVRTVWFPLDEVVRAQIRTVNAAATVFSTLAGVVLVAGALALDAAADDEESEGGGVVDALVLGMLEPDDTAAPRRSIRALRDLQGPANPAEETEFWVMEWKSVDATPDEDGRYRVRLENVSNVPRGIDEAKLVVVDHPPGTRVAPDSLGFIHTLSDPVPPAAARDRSGRDIIPLIGFKDDSYWRGTMDDAGSGAKGEARDELRLEFPRPPGARRAKLVVSAANAMWRSEFASRARGAGGEPSGARQTPYKDSEFHKLAVWLETVLWWQTGQIIFAGGPLPVADMVYGLDLNDVCGNTVRIMLAPPAGYWLIDRLALDFSEDVPVEAVLVDAEATDGPDAGAALDAVAVEDGSALFLEEPGSWSTLTFAVPAPKDGMERTIFLRTVSCYEMTPRAGAAFAPPVR